jgi:hypothetical protein
MSGDRPLWHLIRWFERSVLLWPGARRGSRLLTLLLALVVAVPCLAAALSFFEVFNLGEFLDLDSKCNRQDVSCGILTELLGAVLVVGFAFVYLAIWRVRRVVTRGYLRDALKAPDDLVQTATPMPKVVGRDDLCTVIEDDLLADERRPQVIVGGVGAGKTAVLVRLTERLAKRGAVPVPVHLRDAKDGRLDFHALARTRFLSSVEDRVLSEDEGDRIWRKLWNNGLVVVLADGLEESLLDSRDAGVQHRTRRQAVAAAARRAQMRLVITSRPSDTLGDLEAAVVRLEPLNEDAAVGYICAANSVDEAWVRKLAGVAEVVEMPLYLKLARDLAELGRLDEVVCELCEKEAADLDDLTSIYGPRARLAVRVGLLNEWRRCLLDGSGLRGTRVSLKGRDRAIEGLQIMAAQALVRNSLEFDFNDLAPPVADVADPEQVAKDGEALELVERTPAGVRFRHSIMQAYLGSCGIATLLNSDDGQKQVKEALSSTPSRELLMALVMCYFRVPNLRSHIREEVLAATISPSSSAAQPTRFELLASACEIDAMAGGDGLATIGERARSAWKGQRAAARSEGAMAPSGDARLEEAKLRAVEQLGIAGRAEAYAALWHICEHEDAYVVRLHAAQALAAGGSVAFTLLEPHIQRAMERCKELQAVDGGASTSVEDARLLSLQGWVLPVLASSCETPQAQQARDYLDEWSKLVGRVHLGAEACLAQGMKYEANRLPGRAADPMTRPFLIQQTRRLLNNSPWWYSEISLLQALSLWSLDPAFDEGRDDLTEPIRARMDHRHPFVRETARLCVQINEDPSPYLWIDETGAVGHVGPSSGVSNNESSTGLWLTPAAGWLTLEPRAQQLLADMFLMLNLIERGRFEGRELRRRKTVWDAGGVEQGLLQDALPRCLTEPRERSRFGLEKSGDEPGAGCPKHCKQRLCPYPAKEERPFRGELSQGFCRRQQILLRRHRTPPAWQSQVGRWEARAKRSKLKAFWKDLERRGEV